MEINQLVKLAHGNAVAKGFWDSHNDINDLLDYTSNNTDLDTTKLVIHNNNAEITSKLMLVVSEIGEAVEAMRNNRYARLDTIDKDYLEPFEFERLVKDTFEDELADVFIRLFDLIGFLNIDIDRHIELKMKYNESRDKLHGKQF